MKVSKIARNGFNLFKRGKDMISETFVNHVRLCESRQAAFGHIKKLLRINEERKERIKSMQIEIQRKDAELDRLQDLVTDLLDELYANQDRITPANVERADAFFDKAVGKGNGDRTMSLWQQQKELLERNLREVKKRPQEALNRHVRLALQQLEKTQKTASKGVGVYWVSSEW